MALRLLDDQEVGAGQSVPQGIRGVHQRGARFGRDQTETPEADLPVPLLPGSRGVRLRAKITDYAA